MKKVFWLFVKTVLIIAAFLFIAFSVLANIGGNSDVLRGAIEGYASELSGQKASIGQLNNMQFFPDVLFDLEDLKIEDADQRIIFSVDQLKLSFSFFDLLFSKNRYRVFEVKNLFVAENILMPPGIFIQTVRIKEDEQKKGQLVFQGHIGQSPVSGVFAMQSSGSPGRRSFVFGDVWDFQILLAELAMQGRVQKDPLGDLKIEPFSLVQNKATVLSGHLDLMRLGDLQFDIKGRLQVKPHDTIVQPSVTLRAAPFSVTGQMGSEKFVYEDFFAKASPVSAMINRGYEIFSGATQQQQQTERFLPGFDLDLKIEALHAMNINWGSVQARLVSQDRLINFSPVTGKILGGDLKGEMNISAQDNAAKMRVDFKVSDMPFPRDQDNHKSVMFDANVMLSAQANEMDHLHEKLNGTISLVGDKGQIMPQALTILGKDVAGLVGSKDQLGTTVNMNCTVLNFALALPMLRAQSVFMDAEKFMISGQGVYDFYSGLADFIFESREKNLSKAAQVYSLTGKPGALEIIPGEGKVRTQGLVRDAKAPGFSAVSVQGVELAADHPCKAYVIESEILPPPVYNQKAP